MDEDLGSLAAGWDAITEALAVLYGLQQPVHWGTVQKYMVGGEDPLDGVSAFDAGDHWHYVSFGLSELYKTPGGPAEERSGWGFELTFRLRKDGDAPPVWPVGLLQTLARYVFRSGNAFDAGHKMGLNGPIGGLDTALGSIVFAADPELPPIDTENGRLRFLQAVGITDDERLAASAWDAKKLVALAAEYSPLLVTDPRRESWLSDPAFRDAWDRGRQADGSSTQIELVTQLAWRLDGGTPVITIGAISVPAIGLVLAGRIPFGRGYTLASATTGVLFLPTDGPLEAEVDGDDLVVQLPAATALAWAERVGPARGRTDLDGLVIEVVPTEIKDRTGAVLRTIG